MQPLPQLEQCLRLAWEARGPLHPSGIALASYFVRAPTRGRRRSDVDAALLFPASLQPGASAVARAMDQSTWQTCSAPRPTLPVATREWLAEAALALGRDAGSESMWALLRAASELELAAQQLLGLRSRRTVVRQVLHGVSARTLRVEPFAALVVRVLKIAQPIYVSFRHDGAAHAQAWKAVDDRLWNPHPTGQRTPSGAEVLGAYLPSLVQAASGNARRRLRRNAEARRTVDGARVLLARFALGPGRELWPWRDASGRWLPHGDEALTPEVAGLCFFVLLTHAASERRARGGPAACVSSAFAEAGFAASEWLPDRTDDVALRLFSAASADGIPPGEMLDALSLLVRSTLASGAPRALDRLGLTPAPAGEMIDRARAQLPGLLRWLEENARELLETP